MSYDNELYQQVILDHNRKPRNFREIKDATHVALCRYFKDNQRDGVEIYWVKPIGEFKKNHYVRDFGYGPKMCLK